MSGDFFSKDEEKAAPVETPTEAPKVKVGEAEYSQDELSDLVGLGKLAKEAETKYNTKLDRVWPEYGRSQNKVKELESQLEELKTKKEEPAQDLNPAEVQQAREAAKKIGIVTEDKFDEYLDKRFRTRYLQERSAEKLLEECEGYEGEIDGKDGRPAFKKETVLNHMVETGIKNPERAYKDLYEKELDAWKETQFEKMKKPGFTSQTETTGAKFPKEEKVTDKNLRSALEEALYGKGG